MTPTVSISILLPNYNYSVVALVNALHRQFSATKIPFQIICFDDAQVSDFHAENQKLNILDHVTYQINQTVLGRANNRNALAETAQFNYLLFLDADAGLANNSNFARQYVEAAKPKTVVCGGTAYEKHPPENLDFYLRYYYGKKREELAAAKRQLEEHVGFSAFNFLIPRNTFFELKFENILSQYGHEDTLFGKALKNNRIPVLHVDNPALHLGLDTNAIFLEKTRKGVENLRQLIDKNLVDEDVKLYAYYAKVKQYKMARFLAFLYVKNHKKWEKMLSSPKPNLVLFDLYKLAYLCSLP